MPKKHRYGFFFQQRRDHPQPELVGSFHHQHQRGIQRAGGHITRRHRQATQLHGSVSIKKRPKENGLPIIFVYLRNHKFQLKTK